MSYTVAVYEPVCPRRMPMLPFTRLSHSLSVVSAEPETLVCTPMNLQRQQLVTLHQIQVQHTSRSGICDR